MSEWPKKVRTTMRPDEEIEVGRQEYTDLERQGLLAKNKSGEPKNGPAAKGGND